MARDLMYALPDIVGNRNRRTGNFAVTSRRLERLHHQLDDFALGDLPRFALRLMALKLDLCLQRQHLSLEAFSDPHGISFGATSALTRRTETHSIQRLPQGLEG